MKADPKWLNKPSEFWHYVRAISETLGYSQRKKVRRHKRDDITRALKILELSPTVLEDNPIPGLSVDELVDYFDFRADFIDGPIASNLQTAEEARALFEEIVEKCTDGGTYTSRYNKGGEENLRLYKVRGGVEAQAPYNKQKGSKRDVDYLTASTNILISYYLQGETFDQDPRRIPLVTEDGVLTGSMSRRMDGAYPKTVNPSAVWEFKCYYYTTTFGSKISDAVYITDLDGRERDDIREESRKHIHTSLFIDAYSTFMEQGMSYLARFVDLLQRGSVDNLIAGREIVDAVPVLVDEWRQETRQPGEADK